MSNVTQLNPDNIGGYWKPSAAQLKAIRAYCAKVEGMKPRQIVIELGERYNIDRGMHTCVNLCRVSRESVQSPSSDWDDTDLNQHWDWGSLKRGEVPLDRHGWVVIDFYISKLENFGFGFERGELLGNAQVYAKLDAKDGKVHIVGFSSTEHPYREENIV